MATSPDPAQRSIDSALLLLSREPDALVGLLEALLDDAALRELARLAARRKPGRPDPAQQVADFLGSQARLRRQTAAAVAEALPAAGDDHPWAAVADQLRGGELSDWESLLEEVTQEGWAWPEAPRPAAAPAASPTEPAPASPPRCPEPEAASREQRLQQQLKEARRELAQLQDELGQERRRRQADSQDRDAARAEAESERQRATDLKQQLQASSAASDRESTLEQEAKALRHDLHVATQKLTWLEEERDDLRDVLADHDRFDAIDEEEVPSFRDRPLTQPEQDLQARLRARREDGHPSFRVLVVGGGQPQHRHRDKLIEYAEVMQFTAQWRMAEYQAWHRALDGLARDMQDHFDALIILHWNRTTFTRKAREICDRGGAKPCLTCHYEGFTNLRESLQECLRELLAGAERQA